MLKKASQLKQRCVVMIFEYIIHQVWHVPCMIVSSRPFPTFCVRAVVGQFIETAFILKYFCLLHFQKTVCTGTQNSYPLHWAVVQMEVK